MVARPRRPDHRATQDATQPSDNTQNVEQTQPSVSNVATCVLQAASLVTEQNNQGRNAVAGHHVQTVPMTLPGDLFQACFVLVSPMGANIAPAPGTSFFSW